MGAMRDAMALLTDEQAIAAIDGDEDAWAAIVRVLTPRLRAKLWLRTRGVKRYAQDALIQDVMQSTWERAWRGRAGFVAHGTVTAASLVAWLTTIAMHLLIDTVRLAANRYEMALSGYDWAPKLTDEGVGTDPLTDQVADEDVEADVLANEVAATSRRIVAAHLEPGRLGITDEETTRACLMDGHDGALLLEAERGQPRGTSKARAFHYRRRARALLLDLYALPADATLADLLDADARLAAGVA